jgi:flagellar biogenesis protein FliO
MAHHSSLNRLLRRLARPLVSRLSALLPTLLLLLLSSGMVLAETAGSPEAQTALNLPSHDAGQSILRLLAAFVFVLAVFLVGVWLLRNWQRLALRHHAAPRLNIFEAKSLGNRQLLFVVGYEQQRMLVGASPGGITLLTLLPEATDPQTEPRAPVTDFAHILTRFLPVTPPSPVAPQGVSGERNGVRGSFRGSSREPAVESEPTCKSSQ